MSTRPRPSETKRRQRFRTCSQQERRGKQLIIQLNHNTKMHHESRLNCSNVGDYHRISISIWRDYTYPVATFPVFYPYKITHYYALDCKLTKNIPVYCGNIFWWRHLSREKHKLTSAWACRTCSRFRGRPTRGWRGGSSRVSGGFQPSASNTPASSPDLK